MKLNVLEAHDRLQHLQKDQWQNICQGAEDFLKKNSLSLALQSKSPYVYLFAHPRTADNGVDKRLLWQPRISKPSPQTNSYLFRAVSHSDIIEVCWLLPPEEMWSQYEPGKVTESDLTMWSINQYRYHRQELARPHAEDLPDETGKRIYLDVVRSMKFKPILNLPPKKEIDVLH
jgi:hypothetical protein